MRRILLVVGFVFTLTVSGCAGDGAPGGYNVPLNPNPVTVESPTAAEPEAKPQAPEYPTDGCESAMAKAETALKAHYAKWGGDIGPAEEDAYQAVMAPLYNACDGREDLEEGFKAYPYVAGVTSAQFVDDIWMQVFCAESPSSRSCKK